jgi:lysyl-tRNA synthetase class 2
VNSNLWQPSADIETLKKRGEIIRTIREFFYQRNVMEVETPSLSQASVTDIHLKSFTTEFVGPNYNEGLTLYLQTSPEYAMKRLLAAGSGAIFQICKAFRNEESGKHHNPEFSMLEWYRPGFDHFALMDEIDLLIQSILKCEPASRMTYQSAFENIFNINPLTASLAELKVLCCGQGFENIANDEKDKDTLLQLLFSMVVEPKIGQDKPCFIYDFPASQAALAKINTANPLVADRFELYYKNMELANGFNELTDGNEQLKRFEQDNIKRNDMRLVQVKPDHNLINALNHGMPECAGVALGIDRLIMLALQKKHIKQVVSFAIERS